MKKTSVLLGLLLVVSMILAGCAAKSASASIVGKWASEQDGQVIEFTAEGGYKGVEQKAYTYEIIDDKQIKIVNPEYADGSDSVTIDYKLEGDVLTTTSKDFSLTWQTFTET